MVAVAVSEQKTTRSVHSSLHSSASNEWFTSSEIIDCVWDIMGGIDLDPASCPEANEVVGAKRIYTIEDDGLSQPWKARRLYMNPPFGKTGNTSNVKLWLDKLFGEYELGHTKEAIVLTNATPDSEWFRGLWDCWVCFLYQRVRFWRADGQAKQPTHGNVLAYLGPDATKFAERLEGMGRIVPPFGWREIARNAK